MAKQIDTALVFENQLDGSSIQFEIDTFGYSITIFDADGGEATMSLPRTTLVRLTNFMIDTVTEGE